VGNQMSALENVFRPLSRREAGTPNVLMLFPSITWYLSRSARLPVAQMPDVYDGRMNSSAMWRLSTFIQNGKFPSTLRVPGNDLIPPPRVKYLLNVYCRFPARTTCAPCPWLALEVQA